MRVTSMNSLRCLVALGLGIALLNGCNQPPKQETGPTRPSDSVIATAKAKYASLQGTLVGDVVGASDDTAAVKFEDARTLDKARPVLFIDASNDQTVRSGMFSEMTPSGYHIFRLEKQGARPVRVGDIAVQSK